MADLVHNRKAGFNYEILEKFDAGMELFGFEVKALRSGQGSLEGAFVKILGREAYLLNAHIPPFQPANAPADYEPTRTRRLLLTKKEIDELAGKQKMKQLTIVPIGIYNKGGKLKLSLAVARGKKKYDKRETIKRRDLDREARREI